MVQNKYLLPADLSQMDPLGKFEKSIHSGYLESELNATCDFVQCSMIREIYAMVRYASLHSVSLPQIYL